MKLRVLRYFAAVVEAAGRFHVTQPTLSRQLAQLEDELGCCLLIRSRNNRKVEMTDAGRLLFARAQQLLRLAEKTERELKDPAGSLGGEIFIGARETQKDAVYRRRSRASAETAAKGPHSPIQQQCR